MDTGIDRIFAYNQVLADNLINGLISIDAEITSPQNVVDRSPIVTARFPRHDIIEVAKHLKRNSVMVALRGDVIRFSPHLYNQIKDVDRALNVLSEMP